MSGKRLKAIVAAVMLALALVVSTSPAVTHSVVFAEECSATASGCH